MTELLRRLTWRAGEGKPWEDLAYEWLVTNGLGGYAAGTVVGAVTRRYPRVASASPESPMA